MFTAKKKPGRKVSLQMKKTLIIVIEKIRNLLLRENAK